MIFRFIGDTFMGRRWWQKEARRIQNQKVKTKVGSDVEQAEAVEITSEVSADAIDELNETLSEVSEDSIVNESPVLDETELDESEESFESTDFTEENTSDDVVEEHVSPVVTGTFNQNNNTFKKKKRR
jgi:hypothetical protein